LLLLLLLTYMLIEERSGRPMVNEMGKGSASWGMQADGRPDRFMALKKAWVLI